MIRSKRVQIVFILVFVLSAFVFGQDKQDEQDKQLREEILSVYESKGEKGLREFFEKQKDKISKEFIVKFAKAGKKERKEKWLKICEIMAEEKKNENEKVLADVLFQKGEYFTAVGQITVHQNGIRSRQPIRFGPLKSCFQTPACDKRFYPGDDHEIVIQLAILARFNLAAEFVDIRQRLPLAP